MTRMPVYYTPKADIDGYVGTEPAINQSDTVQLRSRPAHICDTFIGIHKYTGLVINDCLGDDNQLITITISR